MDVDRHWSGDSYNNIMKDYAINWILYTVWRTPYWKKIVLKGGTCLRKAYFKNYRISIDIDYNINIESQPPETVIEQIFLEGLKKTNQHSPVRFHIEEIKIKERRGVRFHTQEIVGYQISIPFTPYLPYQTVKWRGQSPVIKVDITLEKYERTLLPLEIRHLQYPYQDAFYLTLRPVEISAYSLEEIFAEKIRALLQRERVRDLYDLWFIKNYGEVNLESVTKIIPEKLMMKRLTLKDFRVETLREKKDVFRDNWYRYLSPFVRDVPDFNKVWTEIETTFLHISKEMSPDFEIY